MKFLAKEHFLVNVVLELVDDAAVDFHSAFFSVEIVLPKIPDVFFEDLIHNFEDSLL